MEIMDGFSRWDNIRDIAYNCKNKLDRPPRFYDEELAKDAYKEFLRAKIKNPTIADTAMKEVVQKSKITYPQHYLENIESLQDYPSVVNLEKQLSKEIEKLYPNSLEKRQSLISERKVSLDEVPKKLNRCKKFMLKLKSLI